MDTGMIELALEKIRLLMQLDVSFQVIVSSLEETIVIEMLAPPRWEFSSGGDL